MKLKTLLFTLSASCLLSVTAFSDNLTPVTNLDSLKAQIVKYHDSGAYQYDMQQVEDQAQIYLAQRVAENKAAKDPQKLAVVFDIDETALSNYPNFYAHDFSGNSEGFRKEQILAQDPAISASLKLYQLAIHNGVTVFFITGRQEDSRTFTLKNLMNTGYTSVKDSTQNCETLPTVSEACSLFFRYEQYASTPSAIPYKTAMRKKIEDAGYDIVVNIGDQYSDLAGGYSEHTYKYPNYMYYIP